MTIFQAIILGITQGLTEFLPVSSSAHLVLVPYFAGWSLPPEEVFPFDVIVQLGTLLAVILFFFKDLWAVVRCWISDLVRRQPFARPESRLGWLLILATIPAGIFGLLVKKTIEAAFHSPLATALFLFGTAFLLLIGEHFGRQTRSMSDLNWKDALWIGIAQAVSVFPGISRSGATISGGLTRGLNRPDSARFSFLMSIPVMLAAGLLSILDLVSVPNLTTFLPNLAVGFIAAGIVGYFSIRWLLSFISRRSLTVFAIYCLALGTLTIITGYIQAAI